MYVTFWLCASLFYQIIARNCNSHKFGLIFGILSQLGLIQIYLYFRRIQIFYNLMFCFFLANHLVWPVLFQVTTLEWRSCCALACSVILLDPQYSQLFDIINLYQTFCQPNV